MEQKYYITTACGGRVCYVTMVEMLILNAVSIVQKSFVSYFARCKQKEVHITICVEYLIYYLLYRLVLDCVPVYEICVQENNQQLQIFNGNDGQKIDLKFLVRICEILWQQDGMFAKVTYTFDLYPLIEKFSISTYYYSFTIRKLIK